MLVVYDQINLQLSGKLCDHPSGIPGSSLGRVLLSQLLDVRQELPVQLDDDAVFPGNAFDRLHRGVHVDG